MPPSAWRSRATSIRFLVPKLKAYLGQTVDEGQRETGRKKKGGQDGSFRRQRSVTPGFRCDFVGAVLEGRYAETTERIEELGP